MSPHVVAQTAVVFAAATIVRRRVPGMAGALVAIATLPQGRDQVRAVANANSSLPLRIWSDSGSKDARKDYCWTKCSRSELRLPDVDRPASQSSGMPAVNL